MTTTFTIRPKVATIHDAAELAQGLVPFVAGGNAYGRPNLRGGRNEGLTGRLAPEHLHRYYVDEAVIDYVVYSYHTPIAWHTPDGWTVPQARYTPSTSRHQSALYVLVTTRH